MKFRFSAFKPTSLAKHMEHPLAEAHSKQLEHTLY